MRLFFLTILLLSASRLYAQQDLIYVKLDRWARDDRFDKYELLCPLYVTENDTIETNDFENLKDAVKVPIRKPAGHKNYAYGYFFFNGVGNALNPGFTTFLVANYTDRVPLLYVDRNNNYDFNDDGPAAPMMMVFNYTDTLLVQLNRADNADAGIAVKLTRMNFHNKLSYRKMLNDYYAFFYKSRKFAGIEYCFREQRYVARSGVVKYGTDSFRIALYDGNTNGLFNDKDTDRVITANMVDSVFDSRDPLRTFTISGRREDMFIEKNGEQFEILQIDPAGKFMVLKSLNETIMKGRLEAGAKIPKFRFFDWQGKNYKIKKFRKYEVFIYFTGPNVKNFSKDTADLRRLADAFPDKLKVIAFIDVNKSYELKIFGSYSNLNWIAAFKDKDINRDLRIRGLPSSLWVGRKRKVVKYNLTPEKMLEEVTGKLKKN